MRFLLSSRQVGRKSLLSPFSFSEKDEEKRRRGLFIGFLVVVARKGLSFLASSNEKRHA